MLKLSPVCLSSRSVLDLFEARCGPQVFSQTWHTNRDLFYGWY